MNLKLNYYLFILMLSFPLIASSQPPLINDENIIFNNGKKLYIDNSSSQVEPLLINKWKRFILLSKKKLIEGEVKQISIYDFNGNVISPSIKFEGDLKILLNVNRILLAQNSYHNLIKESLLLDENGVLIKKINQSDNVFMFGYSEDEIIFWIMSNHIKSRQPYILVKVFDFNGNEIGSYNKYDSGKINVNFNSLNYEIDIPEPKIPG